MQQQRHNAPGRALSAVEYDISSKLVDSVEFVYDSLGNLIRTVLPDGRSLEYTLGGSGFLFQVGLAAAPGGKEEVIAAFEREALQRLFQP